MHYFRSEVSWTVDTLELISLVRSEGHLRPYSSLQTISLGAVRAMLAVRVQKTEKDQSPGLGFYTTSWNTFGHLSAENGHSVILQSPVALFSSKLHECAYVSVLEEYKGRRLPGCVSRIKQVICIICIIYIMSIIFVRLAGPSQRARTMLYERKQNQQVLYVIPISSILGKLPLIPVGDTGTIPFSMQD